MAYLAMARAWRPSQFEDLVGQGHVVQTLRNALKFNRVSHAYLFSGARGVGKTSVARIFAKALRCPNAKDAIPCNQCPECIAIAESRSVDVVEIDGASNNGVEAVRGIRENVPYGASSGTYKIYIIDEVHMLSISAFNALLKTLEEPPAHVIFLFATTEVQKIPVTILSRCQRFEFRRLTNQQIVDRLKQILDKEPVKLSEEALRTISSHSDGALRDALSLLDQVLSYYGQTQTAGTTLSEKQVVEALGVHESSSVRKFFSMIFQEDIAGVVKLLEETHLAGIDLKHFAERCLEELRLIYLIAVGRQSNQSISAELLDISSGQFNELAALVKTTPLIQIERAAQILSRSIQQLGWASLPRFVLEMAAVRMCKLKELESLEGQGATGSDAEEKKAAPAVRTAPVSAPVQAPPPAANAAPPPSAPARPQAPSAPPAPRPEASSHSWKTFVETVMKKRPLMGALLSHANFRVEMEGNIRHLHLAFASGSFYERQAVDNRNEIHDQLKMFYGPETKLSLSTDLGNTSQSLEESRRVEEDTLKKSALRHPTVMQMKQVLGAEVVDVNVD